MKLSKRLWAVAQYVNKEARLADIGSDHAHLPIWLAQDGQLVFGVAGEVVKGPYDNAVDEVQRAGLSNLIAVRLGDGLDVIDRSDQIDTITICGMGGRLISDILERGLHSGRFNQIERLILQPNVGESVLRSFLTSINYQIIAEEILEEQGQIYEIIVAEPADSPIQLSEDEQMFGKFLLQEQSAIFKQKWQGEYDKLDHILEQLMKASGDTTNKIAAIKQQQQRIKEMIQS
ncbi:tRNA (adenine(22)-N(1))-methyltransferase [Dolosigranulum pigrum]|uniref:tRNA (adenine(22)-N(1))-methyltransferase n=1 Tax=Dolosigranulum pigrum TaxID=29394 RepID=UPI001AD88D15|nr:tRNA (adenine(22)-N(1))-methyltransferase TrmK [Dolosigranulum pigrum]QTJ36349.1 tRNA (adenine-N(1))-methyltransferase [Dolosigranulum pigrum]QTJ58488.1 tRNA (adenine-N(1))-methyltransferase [Dolosigranulum pigrum]